MDYFRTSKRGETLLVTLSNPPYNTVHSDILESGAAMFGELANDPPAGGVVLTGEGEDFTRGMDTKVAATFDEAGANRARHAINIFCASLHRLPCALVSAVNGHAIGAGLCAASACDIRIAAEGAKLGFTFVKLGLHPGMGATYFLTRAIGYSAALELMLTGRVIKTEEAMRLGLVSESHAADAIVDRAKEIADEICTAGPEAVRQLLESMRTGPRELPAALAREAVCQSINYASSEFKEGVRAIQEKRPPSF